MDTFSEHPSKPSSIVLDSQDIQPGVKAWWFHSSSLSLDDRLASLPKQALDEGTWKPFATRDCEALESKWSALLGRIKRGEGRIPDETGVINELAHEKRDENQDDVKVVVGVERLYHVDLIDFRLGPIYWQPLNSFLDSASVLRSIWFVQDTCDPVDQILSRALEEGYNTLRAWSSAYADELSSALALGLEAEDKLRWKVRNDSQGREILFIDAAEAWVIPSVGLVSGLFGTKPVLKDIIEKGKGGIKVKRGYNNLDIPKDGKREKEQIRYTDLILVIHGIGQKLSERVESFTFTHAINRFRVHLNNEIRNDSIENDLRPDYEPCVLPINWRSQLSFDFDRPPNTSSRPAVSRISQSSGFTEANVFTLNDLQPKSIPIVRDLIKDVMLDIPYYLSAHKEKILEAVVAEANRIWDTFGRCNPYFQETGRVHIIGHSLGSVVAMDILSGQPTRISPEDKKVKLHFSFNVTNLFCLGSPAGFFLMLERSSLLPRAGRRKTKDARRTEVDDEHGQFGCLAIDNLYNILDLTDPVALHMNPAVDSDYARNNISPVEIPRTLRPISGGLSQAATLATSLLPSSAPAPETSVIELETHDFRSEARAERIFNMLNDNGGLDFVLTPQGGWVDNQYVSMLTAHSGYWDRKDFARMVVVETGREDGKTVDWLRARKKIV